MERADVPGAPFDVALNQFGLTFATDLQATFARIAGQLNAGGRCVFTAWAEAERNPLLPIPLLAPFRRTEPDQDPFTMADADSTLAVLRSAGLKQVEVRTVEAVNTLPREAVFIESMLERAGIVGAAKVEALVAIDELLASHSTDSGVAVPLVFHVFSAVRP